MTTIAAISKEFAFSASHQLDGLPDTHQCSRLHGHNYVVRVELIGRVLEPGFVVDYSELSFVKDLIDTEWDHRHLNDRLSFNPTAELMAEHLAELVMAHLDRRYPNVSQVCVHVSETPKTWATVSMHRDEL